MADQTGLDPNTGNSNGIGMNSLPSNVANRYVSRVTILTNRLTSLDAMLDILVTSRLKSYEFKSGDGSQKGERWSLTEVQTAIRSTSNELRNLERQLYGRGLMTVRNRRKP